MNDETNPDNKVNKPAADKVRRRDRRPKGIEPMRRRSICWSPKIDRLAENEMLRRGYPSVSAYVESAVAKDVSHKAEPEEADLLRELQQIGLRLHRIERESTERDIISTELLAGFVRTYLATAEQPAPEQRQARITEAKAQYEKFLNAVGRKIESGETTLQTLPDVNFAPRPAEEANVRENNSSGGEDGEGANNASV